MSACEKCWADAYRAEMGDTSKSQAEHYRDIRDRRTLFGPICTAKEQAGQFWDEEKQCDSRLAEYETSQAHTFSKSWCSVCGCPCRFRHDHNEALVK